MADAQQRRGRSIAMTPAELDDFLAQARTCRVASLAPDGPHVVPLWFVWAGGALWLSSVVRSQRWTDLIRDPRVAAVVDTGEEYQELRGAEIKGTAVPVGEVPRRAAARTTPSWPGPKCCSPASTWAAARWPTTGGTAGCASRRPRSPAGTSASCRPSGLSQAADPRARPSRHPQPGPLAPPGYASVSSTGVRPGCGVFCEIHASIRAHQS